eukprot:872961-Heterocapsa_arctica.AAC.1
MGLPGLCEKDALKVKVGNSLLAVTLRILRACRLRLTPVSVENPRRSRLWWTLYAESQANGFSCSSGLLQ